jgi:hypothetical protein
MTRVLLIERNRDLAATPWDYLESHGLTVDHATDSMSGLHWHWRKTTTSWCWILACRGSTDSRSVASCPQPAGNCRC